MFAQEPPAGIPITALSFSPGGEFLAVGSQAGVRILRWSTRVAIGTIQGSPESVHRLQWTDQGLLVAGGIPGESGVIGIADMRALIAAPQGPAPSHFEFILRPLSVSGADVFYDARWSPDRSQVAAACLDGSAFVIHLSPSVQTIELSGHSAGVTGIDWLDESTVVTSSRDSTIRVWAAPDSGHGPWGMTRTLDQHTDQVVRIAAQWSTDSTPLLASIGLDRTVRFWQPKIGRMMRFRRLEQDRPTSLAWQADGENVVVGTESGEVLVIDRTTASLVQRKTISDDWITSIAVSDQGTIASGSELGEMDAVTFP